jgi:mono/diheme cytochrome c family protein
MTYIPVGGALPAWAGRLAVAQGGLLSQPGPSRDGRTIVSTIPVRAGQGLTALPETVAWFSGSYLQLPVPVAAGPDGLYFSGFLPDNQGETVILKIVPRPGARPKSEAASGETLFRERACEGCHQLQGRGGGVGPALDRLVDRLRERLAAPAYRELVLALRASQNPVHEAYRVRREALLDLSGEDQVRAWIVLRLEEPAFDMAEPAMPKPNLTPAEIERLADYLMTLRGGTRELAWQARLKIWWDTDRNARPIVAFMLGVVLTLIALIVPRRLRRRVRGKAE